MALLRKETCNLRHPVHLRHPVVVMPAMLSGLWQYASEFACLCERETTCVYIRKRAKKCECKNVSEKECECMYVRGVYIHMYIYIHIYICIYICI